MGDRKGLFTTMKRYWGIKINGGERQNGVTWGQTDELTEKREDGATSGTDKYGPCACLNKQKSLANVQAAKAFAHSRGVSPTRGTIICCTTRLYILSLNCFLL